MYLTLPQSQISKCLKRSAELIGKPDSVALHNQERKKRGPVTYPGLHEVLFVCIMAIEKDVTITGTMPGDGVFWCGDWTREGLFLRIFI